MTPIFLLEGVITPYDGSVHLGVFGSLEAAQKGRSTFREFHIRTNHSEPYESYSIYELTLDELLLEEAINKLPVDTFYPSKTKYNKGKL